MSHLSPTPRRGRRGTHLYIRLAFLAALLIAVLVFHASGTTLVVMRVVRLVLIVALVIGAGLVRRRRGPRAGGDSD